jgi:hypothetical protein
VLVGAGAILSGVARIATHRTSGALLGGGAVVVGSAALPTPPNNEQVLAIPRFGLRVKTGELFPLVLGADNVPIGYLRNGSQVSIRLINASTRSAAINAQGDVFQII